MNEAEDLRFVEKGERRIIGHYCSTFQMKVASVTNMESLFPAVLVLWLGREFYRVRAGELSVIASAVTVIISELLTVCVARSGSSVTVIASDLLPVPVANLYECYCSCYLCFVFTEYSRINRHSPLSCLLDCFRHTPTGQFL
ncbi:hypothetical protein AVEN_220380-1 [Araneus ventricosus]|uniref:Uncharacterized protein n=1 Tax=Araneus ventricosus TaxID=182803 RepID=A0A4Y2SE51_ARAVE|nr:hypothetical protein AVEN_220380-1 [Araneus ventricosus]